MDFLVGDERSVLDGMVDRQRAELAALLDDLDDEYVRLRLVPSLTTVLGLVKHAAFVEKVWFHSRVQGIARSDIGLPDTVDESFALTATDTIESVRAEFVEACEKSRDIAARHTLEDTFDWYEKRVSLRYIYAHLIAEYARHAGHGDILVEQIRASKD